MKRPAVYLASVFFTLLLIFTSLAAIAAGVARFHALNTDTALAIVRQQDLAARVHTSLETEFRQRESTTGIPAEVYADAITPEKLEPIISAAVSNGFAYVRGDTASLGVAPDFSGLEEALQQFFADYAAKEGVEKDETYNSAVRDTIAEAEEIIRKACDVYRFGNLNESGMMKQAKSYVPWLGAAVIALAAVSLVLIVILFTVNRREAEHGCYWTATALLIASLLLLIPSAWLHYTRWFDRFAVKTDQTFAAVTGFLYSNTHTMIVTAAIAAAAAVLLYILFAILHSVRRKREIVREAKH